MFVNVLEVKTFFLYFWETSSRDTTFANVAEDRLQRLSENTWSHVCEHPGGDPDGQTEEGRRSSSGRLHVADLVDRSQEEEIRFRPLRIPCSERGVKRKL